MNELALLFLMNNGLEIEGNDDDVYDTVVAIASGKIGYDKTLTWLRKNTETIISA